MGNDVFTLIATSVAVAASLGAVLLAVDQLTSGARLRSLEGVLRAAQECPDGPERDAVVASVRRATLAKIIARDAVPLRSFLFPCVYLGVVLAPPFQAGLMIGSGSGDKNGVGATAFAAVGVVWLGVRMLVRQAFERVRVARCYRKGIAPIGAHLEILAVMEGGSRAEFWLSMLAGVGLTAAAAGPGAFWQLRSVGAAELSPYAWLVLVAALVGVGIVVGCAVRLRSMALEDKTDEPDNRDHSLHPTWVHPDPTDQNPTQ